MKNTLDYYYKAVDNFEKVKAEYRELTEQKNVKESDLTKKEGEVRDAFAAYDIMQRTFYPELML